MPNFALIVDEFVRKAQAVGVPVQPAMKVTDVLERPEAWGAAPGTEGYVAFLGATTDHAGAVEALSAITVAAQAVICVKVLTAAEVDEFQAQARRIVEIRKSRQQAAGAATPSTTGRHSARSAAAAPGSAPVTDEPFELVLSTPEEAQKVPLDILSLVR